MPSVYPLTMTVSVDDNQSSFASHAAKILSESERLCFKSTPEGDLVLKAVWESDLADALSELRRHLGEGLVLSEVSVEYITDDQLLEPVMSVELLTPTDHMGDVVGDLNRRRAIIHSMSDDGQRKRVGAWAPLAPLLGLGSYLEKLAPIDWQVTVTFHSYEPLPPGEGPDPDEPAAQALRA